MKTNVLQVVQGQVFAMPQNKANHWIHTFLPILQVALRSQGDAPARSMEHLAQGEGSKGPRLYDWVRQPLSSPVPQGGPRWLVIRRSIPAGAEAAELTYVLVFARVGTTLQQMARVIGTGFPVEQCFEVGKGEVGLDQYEVRSWQGWYRHYSECSLRSQSE